jgi:MFS family permease
MPTAGNTRLVLAAMIFAVAMTFIDQTIVSLAIPELQKDLGLSATGTQWIINAYLLALSALFAFGGRLADIAGHRRMVVLGVIVFAGASAMCGATPTGGSVAEPWMITFRVIQGAGAAIMFPAALAIVVAAFPVAERGKALAVFFGITGGLTAVGPFLGGYLTEWTWRAIFWVNVPVAIIALILIWRARPDDRRTPAPMDWRGAALIAGGMGLSVLGLQQSSDWGWTSPATIACISLGALLLVAFVLVEFRTRTPLIDVRIFRDRGFAAANGVLFAFSMAFIPVFFFTSMYARSRSARTPRPPACSSWCSSPASAAPPSGAAGCTTSAGSAPPCCRAARWAPWGSSSGPGPSATSTWATSGSGS